MSMHRFFDLANLEIQKMKNHDEIAGAFTHPHYQYPGKE
jgi:hypothetical protein